MTDRDIFVTQSKPSPCMDCPVRRAGCHSSCEEYLAYIKECDRRSLERQNYLTAVRRAPKVRL